MRSAFTDRIGLEDPFSRPGGNCHGQRTFPKITEAVNTNLQLSGNSTMLRYILGQLKRSPGGVRQIAVTKSASTLKRNMMSLNALFPSGISLHSITITRSLTASKEGGVSGAFFG